MKGYPSDKTIAGLLQKYSTIQPLGQGRQGINMGPWQGIFPIDGTSYAPEAGTTANTINLAGHTARVGDILLFDGGVLTGYEVSVISIVAGVSITIAHLQDAVITAAETFRITRLKNILLDSGGGLAIVPTTSAATDARVVASIMTAAPAIPTATRYNTTLTVPASFRATELEIFTKAGDNFTAHTLTAAGAVIARYTQAGSRIPCSLVAGTELHLQSDTGLDFTATDLTINIIGVPV